MIAVLRLLRHRHNTPLAVLGFCLILTGIVWYQAQQQLAKNAEQRMLIQVNDIIGLLQKRMQNHEQILLGTKALFAASKSVERDEWQAYVTMLELGDNYPGIIGVGYSELIQPSQLAQYEARIRADGFPDFQVQPVGKRDIYSAIQYLEPFTGNNLRAFGFDMLSEPRRRQAMQLAGYSGKASISAKINLLQDANTNEPSFLMYVPIYHKDQPLRTESERWHALQGFVYSPYRVKDLMYGILKEKLPIYPSFRLYDGKTTVADNLMYEWDSSETPQHQAKFEITTILHTQQRDWSLVFHSSPAFEQQMSRGFGFLVLGFTCSLLLSGLVWSLSRQRERAFKLAGEMTETMRTNEQLLRVSEHKFRSLVANLPAAVYRYEGPTADNLVYLSEAIQDLTGLAARDFLDSTSVAYQAQIHHEDLLSYQQWRQLWLEASSGEALVLQYRLQTTDQQVLWVEDHCQVLKDPEGQRDCFDGVILDISKHKQIEQMKSEFVSTVSHELRTPLTSISGALGLLHGGAMGVLPEAVQKLVQIAHKNSLRLSNLINDLLDMDKISSGHIQFHYEILDLGDLLAQSIEANQGYANQYQVQLQLSLPTDRIYQVETDAQRLQQVLSNLLSNAIKFSPTEASVEVRLLPISPLQLRIEVQDHGVGIPANFQKRIFAKFSQADASDTRQKGGTGLGLAISKELVERMGGHIGFVSEPNQGCCFYIELPSYQASNSIRSTNENQPRILIVEDEADIAELLRLMLNHAGFSADIALNAKQAEQLLQQQSYQAMTLDLNLPDEPGLSLMQRLRKQPATKDLPILIISAEQRDGHLILGELGPLNWLVKPIQETELRQLLSQILTTHNQRPRILQIEDDYDLNQVVATLAQNIADFDHATHLKQAQFLLSQRLYDLIILDLNLPDGSGWQLLPEIRALTNNPPVLILSSDELVLEQQHQVEAALVKSRTSNDKLLTTLKELIHQRD